jgi:predicted PurR-regulated permease PerM
MSIEQPTQRIVHDVRVGTIAKIVLVLVSFVLLYVVKDIVLIFFVALILAALITPLAEHAARYKIPRSVTILGVYVFLLAVLFFILAALVPPLLDEARNLVTNFSAVWERVLGSAGPLATYVGQRGFEENFRKSLDSVTAQIPHVALGAFSSINGVFQSIVSLLLIFVLAYYMVVEVESLKRLVRNIAPERYQPSIVGVVTRVQRKLGDWMRAQLILSGAVAVLTYVGLLIIGLPYALVLGLLVGVLELVPYAGPVIAAVPGIFLALSLSPFKAVLALAVYVLVQQTESHFLIPKVNQKFVGVNPIVSIMALLLGARLGGILGVLVAIPIAASITMLLEEYFAQRAATSNDDRTWERSGV